MTEYIADKNPKIAIIQKTLADKLKDYGGLILKNIEQISKLEEDSDRTMFKALFDLKRYYKILAEQGSPPTIELANGFYFELKDEIEKIRQKEEINLDEIIKGIEKTISSEKGQYTAGDNGLWMWQHLGKDVPWAGLKEE